MNGFIKAATAAMLSIGLVATASAQGRHELRIVNLSEDAIYSVQMSASSDNSWGRDLLGDHVVPVDYNVMVEPAVKRGCTYDLRVTFVDGRSLALRNINLCATAEVEVYNNGLELIEA